MNLTPAALELTFEGREKEARGRKEVDQRATAEEKTGLCLSWTDNVAK